MVRPVACWARAQPLSATSHQWPGWLPTRVRASVPEAREGLIHAVTGVVLHVLWEEVSPLTPPLLET